MTLATIGQTKLKMHPALPVFALAMGTSGLGSVLATMMVSLTVHECAHALAAIALGLRVPEMELMPFGGVARLEGWQEAGPWRGALVAAAGPLVSLLCAMGGVFAAHLGLVHPGSVQLFVRCNLVLMAVNSLPALPLDGGRMLLALTGRLLGMGRMLNILSGLGILLGVSVIGLGIWAASQGVLNLTLFLTGSYLVYAALLERRQPAYSPLVAALGAKRRLMETGALPVRQLAVRGDQPLSRVAAQLSARHYHRLRVVDDDLVIIGEMEEAQLLSKLMASPNTTMREALRGNRG